MDKAPPAAAFKLPTEPYPGLRPFLDHEAALLLGRGRQVREVIARLRETRFVAVIGGSGSGKSSLIRAGVVPELRGFGIPDAGDYWIPVICTPGTTVVHAGQPAAPGTDRPATEQTPVTRLAWKFSQQLEPAEVVLARRIAADPTLQVEGPIDALAEAAHRRAEIAAVFAQGAGFSRLIDAYFDELPALGPARENARFLFVLDQFEELFHPNNRGNADATALVEAVIDHFFNPHPRCFVILTMRSEHLADCAGFLELPDAINKSSYLVRRLDESELREAIVGPAKYFLRLLQRGGAGSGGALPDDITFEAPVIQRLLADVAKITSDADHLPLLQHVLARIWEAACQRDGRGAERLVPGQITWADLEVAVAPRSKREPGWLHAQAAVNTLRSSLENWAESAWLDRAPAQRVHVDAVLRQLAFKDPNNGQYSQQRVDVDDPRLFAGVAAPRQMLRELLQHGFLDSVNYLFWDKENPDRVTLKVSHESFIRGWAHFRALVDVEAERFEEFVAVLRKCAMWRIDESPDLLLESSELMRLEAARLNPVFDHRVERADWFRVLLQFRDGERLARSEPVVDAFIAASRERHRADEQARTDAAEREREASERAREAEAEQLRMAAMNERAQAETRRAEAETLRAEAVVKRNLWFGITALIVAGVLLPYAVFAVFVQNPVMKSVEKFASARALVERRDRSDSNPVAGAAARELGVLLRAAELVREAEVGVRFFRRDGFRDGLVDYLPPVANSKRLFAISSSEPLVNGSLRDLLTTVVWRNATRVDQLDPSLITQPSRRELECAVVQPGGEGRSVRGSLLLDRDSDRGVFIPARETGHPELTLYVATQAGGTCVAGRNIWSVPYELRPLLVLDARVRYFALAVEGPVAGQPSVSLYSIGWEPPTEGQARLAQVKLRSVVTDRNAVELVRAEVESGRGADLGVPEVKAVPSWREPGGIGVSVSGVSWRMFVDGAQRLRSPGAAADWAPLVAPLPGSGCASLATALEARVQPGFESTMFQRGERCFEVQRGNPLVKGARAAATAEALGAGPPDAPATGAAGPHAAATGAAAPDAAASGAAAALAGPGNLAPREQVLVAVYEQPRPEDVAQFSTAPPASIASIAAFGRFRSNPGEWVIGTRGVYDGWIALRTAASDGSLGTFGAPLTTAALAVLGEQVHALAANPPPVPASAPAGSLAHTPPASSPPPR